MTAAVRAFIDFVERSQFKDRSPLDSIVVAHLYYSDIHTAVALGADALNRYCPTFEKSWVDVAQCADLVPGHAFLNRTILLAVAENRRAVYEKAFELGLIPVSWHGWHPAMRHPDESPGLDRDTRLLHWLDARVSRDADLGGLLYYATAARLGQAYPSLITASYIEAVMTERFPFVTLSLITSLAETQHHTALFQQRMGDILTKRLDIVYSIGVSNVKDYLRSAALPEEGAVWPSADSD